MSKKKSPSKEEGQALTELLVILPVLLLLLLAASDMGKLFAISGKSEIAARYSALRHFREAPFGDVYPAHTRAQEIERLFFDDSLDDRAQPEAEAEGSEADDPDVTYDELGDEDFVYAPGDFGNELISDMWWDILMSDSLLDLAPIRGTRSTFAYDLPSFPYGREHPLKATLPLGAGGSKLDASYEATGNFVMLAGSFSGADGQQIKFLLQAAELAIGAEVSASPWVVSLIGLYYFFFLP